MIARLRNDSLVFISCARDIEAMACARFSVVGATLLGLFSVTAVAETQSPGPTGIEGMIVVSPIRGGPIRKDDAPNVAPMRNAQFVVKAGDAMVKTFTTDGEG
ncbi:MAG TPA: hypothetical protein VF511_11130, partial [Chthoniobacterales bacterium]